MIRVNCPSCQKPHEFLEFYRGLTIFCKHCKAGILVPTDAESVPEGATPLPPAPLPAAAPPPEPEASARETIEPSPVAAEMPREDLPPLAESNHRIQASDPPRPAPAVTTAKPRQRDAEPAPRARSNTRVLILGGALLIILALGGALIARQLMQSRSPVVNIDPSKLPKIDSKPKQEPVVIPEKKPDPEPKPIDEPKKEKPKEKTPLKSTDFIVQSWYTSDHVYYFAPPDLRYYLDDEALDNDFILLVVKARLSDSALNAKKVGGKWEIDLNVAQFFIDNDGEKTPADGFEYKGGFLELVGKESRTMPKLTEKLERAPDHFDIGLVFRVKLEDADDLNLQIGYRDFPTVKLGGATRQKPPAKKVEPEKKVETKTPPKKEETPKKTEPDPKEEKKQKKTEPVKKTEEPKKVVVEPPAEPQVEIVEWIVSDTLPGSDPEKKVMSLSSADRLDGNRFVAVKVKLMGKACAAVKGEVGWKVSLAAKDFSLEGDAAQPFPGRGLESEGAYGSTIAAGYIKWADLVVLFKEAPESIVQGVFFTVPLEVIERGDLVLFYRGFPALKLTDAKRKK